MLAVVAMKRSLSILLVFSMLVAMMAYTAHVAHANFDNASKLSSNIDIDASKNAPDSSSKGDECGMACGGCCISHKTVDTSFNKIFITDGDENRLTRDTSLFVSEFIAGLKRPPKY